MWEAQTLAVAFIFLAAKEAKVEIPSLCGTKRSWWRQFIDRVDVHDLEGEYTYSVVLCNSFYTWPSGGRSRRRKLLYPITHLENGS